MAVSVTMPFELRANRKGSVSFFAVSMPTSRMVKQKKLSKIYSKVLASSFYTRKQGGPMPFIQHYVRMLCRVQYHFTTPLSPLTVGF